MTDLENIWDDYPTGTAPVEAIVREARRAAMLAEAAEAEKVRAVRSEKRHRLLVRPLLTAGVVTGMVGAFVAGTLIDGDGLGSGGDGGDGVEHLPTPAAFAADLIPAKSCDELLAAYVERALPLVGPDGWESLTVELGEWAGGDLPGPPISFQGGAADREQLTDLSEAYDLRAPNAVIPQAYTKRQTNSDTGTNVQEAGVDEPDNVKTDGTVLVRVRDDELVIYDVSGEEAQRLGSVDLDGIEGAEIMLAGDTVVAIGADDKSPENRLRSRLMTVSVADPQAPEITDDITYDGWVESARQHGGTIRLVISSGLPDLDFTSPGSGTTTDEAAEENRQVIRDSKIGDWLPTMTPEGGEAARLADCTSIAVPSDELSLDRVSVVGFDAAEPTTIDAIGFAGATNIAYESTDRLYLAATPSPFAGCWDCMPRVPFAVASGTTYLFQLDLDGTSATHVASGEVEGALQDRWAMDEADGVLRLALTPTDETGNFTSVVTMEREGQDLVELGRLDDLGRGEDMKSVRWFDGLAILVTFRQVDPLYAVDLTDLAAPRLIGELKIPGFSSYLHPLGPGRLVGIGEGPGPAGGWGGQAGLFDVTDLTEIEKLDTQVFGSGSEALAGLDPRAFTWLPEQRRIYTVVAKYHGGREGWLVSMRLRGGEFRTHWERVEYGADVDLVRTVPLPDGKVALVTGEDVRFL